VNPRYSVQFGILTIVVLNKGLLIIIIRIIIQNKNKSQAVITFLSNKVFSDQRFKIIIKVHLGLDDK